MKKITTQKAPRNLRLNKETLLDLGSAELTAVAGGSVSRPITLASICQTNPI